MLLQSFANGAYTNSYIYEDAIVAIANEIAITTAAIDLMKISYVA